MLETEKTRRELLEEMPFYIGIFAGFIFGAAGVDGIYRLSESNGNTTAREEASETYDLLFNPQPEVGITEALGAYSHSELISAYNQRSTPDAESDLKNFMLQGYRPDMVASILSTHHFSATSDKGKAQMFRQALQHYAFKLYRDKLHPQIIRQKITDGVIDDDVKLWRSSGKGDFIEALDIRKLEEIKEELFRAYKTSRGLDWVFLEPSDFR